MGPDLEMPFATETNASLDRGGGLAVPVPPETFNYGEMDKAFQALPHSIAVPRCVRKPTTKHDSSFGFGK